ncbi:MAG: NAD(P)-binding protein [Bdellovibrionaceae bacterium]|nr:NAD(P)-binding protein [Pseudobdellovibrionaceae bacterium]
MAKIKKKYDAVVFGGGFSGLLAAQILRAKNKSFLLVEPSDKLGGRLTAWTAQENKLPSNPNIFALSSEFDHQLFGWLESTLDTRIVDGQFSAPASHLKDGQLKPLTGFGDKNYEALEEYNSFCLQPEKANLTQLPHIWVERLISQLQEDEYVLHSEITSVHVEGKKAQSLTLNGKTNIEFEALIWAQPPQNMLNVVGAQNLSPSDAKKLKRPTKVFDAIMLNLSHKGYTHDRLKPSDNQSSATHSPLLENWPLKAHPEVLCLYGSQDEFEPVIGTISSDSSCWMTLVPSELSLDNEFVAKVIKNMKKQIKRPFPDLFEQVSTEEKIILSENAYGYLPLKENDHGYLKDISNLFCVSSLCSPAQGLMGALDRAMKLENNL